ncbi:hypothetical protein PORCRE_268 [Porphyromonas crevioricanis JCM 15906]|uniref:Uncharacterized protein n=1 Tax=Porphyromonas crevioricanis JCM 15906 TaxID=1305617 RepID=S4PGF6_9PORP|nr:hypothetical protein PORCRE_268 [Porphyromonas crevioricanis JCM 15906]GAD08451.1 hypothetical protein PORCAN_2093 [Porphyromonas crevioricanis JCM 13913]
MLLFAALFEPLSSLSSISLFEGKEIPTVLLSFLLFSNILSYAVSWISHLYPERILHSKYILTRLSFVGCKEWRFV